ncbi:hypothetical protein [Micromonospora pisi]|uniref:hypothetical protein n=1 Tax=Micromonospora pisi TaxID=589240 RepID=UPI001FE86CC4|nr:hypothetical protein [Micromonospora pisi]
MEFEREALQYEPVHPDQRATQLTDLDAGIAELDEALGETNLRGYLTAPPRTLEAGTARGGEAWADLDLVFASTIGPGWSRET